MREKQFRLYSLFIWNYDCCPATKGVYEHYSFFPPSPFPPPLPILCRNVLPCIPSNSPGPQEVLQEAQKLFDAAPASCPPLSHVTSSYSSLLLLGKELEEMRWFLLPHEAQLQLTGHSAGFFRVPFEPKAYESDQSCLSIVADEWDRHWNPSYWQKTRERRGREGQWMLYPAISRPNGVPARYGQGTPIRVKSMSLTCLYTDRFADTTGSTGSLNGLSSDSSGGESRRRWRRRRGRGGGRGGGRGVGREEQTITFKQSQDCTIF